jgi:hypothetical protein
MKTLRFPGALAGAALPLLAGARLQGRAPAAQAVPKVVRAHSFELVGRGRQVRATLDTRGLQLRDSNGTIRVKLGGDVNGSGLLLANERTEVGVHALATRTHTWVVVQRGDRRRVIRP